MGTLGEDVGYLPLLLSTLSQGLTEVFRFC